MLPESFDTTANQILHYDGFTWSDADPHLRAVATYRGIWGSAANDIWAVGNSAEIIHYDGSTWSSAATLITGAVLGHVWGAAADSVWAVGEDSGSPLILYWDGTQWIDQSPAVSGWFAGVWGTSATNVWAVGGSGTPMWHYDGTDWTAVASISPSASLRAVFGSGPTDVWAVGNEVVYHYDGTDWTDVSPVFAPAVSLSGVWMPAGDPAGDIWAVGGAGTILRGTR